MKNPEQVQNGWRLLKELKKVLISLPPYTLFNLKEEINGDTAIARAFAYGDHGRDNVNALNDLVRNFNLSVHEASYLTIKDGRKNPRFDLCIQASKGMTKNEFREAMKNFKDVLSDDNQRVDLISKTHWSGWYNQDRANGLLNSSNNRHPEVGPFILPQLVSSLDVLIQSL